MEVGGREHSTIDSVLALHPAAPGSIPGIAEVNQQCCFLEQWAAEA